MYSKATNIRRRDPRYTMITDLGRYLQGGMPFHVGVTSVVFVYGLWMVQFELNSGLVIKERVSVTLLS